MLCLLNKVFETASAIWNEMMRREHVNTMYFSTSCIFSVLFRQTLRFKRL